MWIERFEKEKSDHSMTQQDLMKTRSELKDQVLAFKSSEIKLSTNARQIQVL